MKDYYNHRDILAQSVADLAQFSSLASPLTMTITQEKSGGYSVSIVTGASSEDTELQTAKFFSDTQPNT